MRFSKKTFWIAGVWGVLVLAPTYFMYGKVGQYTPPSPTHPEFYYGFLGLALVWQFAFFVIAMDPARFRTMMIPSIFEKALYVGALVVLYVQNRITELQLSAAAPDTILCLLFVTAFFKARSTAVAKLKESHALGGMQ